MLFNNIELPANATYSLGRIGNQVHQIMHCWCIIISTTLQLHLIVTMNGPLSPNSTVGMYVLADENNTEYTAITIKAGGMQVQYKYVSMHVCM